MKMIREFYRDLNSYSRNKKWMIFDFYVRQPLTLVSSIIQLLGYMGEAFINRTDMFFLADTFVLVLVDAVLLFGTLTRKQYSFLCLTMLVVMQTVTNFMNKYYSAFGLALAVVCLTPLMIYYYKRKDFFYKENTKNEDRKQVD